MYITLKRNKIVNVKKNTRILWYTTTNDSIVVLNIPYYYVFENITNENKYYEKKWTKNNNNIHII